MAAFSYMLEKNIKTDSEVFYRNIPQQINKDDIYYNVCHFVA